MNKMIKKRKNTNNLEWLWKIVENEYLLIMRFIFQIFQLS